MLRTLGLAQLVSEYLTTIDLMLGVGGTTEWFVESAPPSPNPSASEIPELSWLIPVTVTSVGLGPGPIAVDGRNYSTPGDQLLVAAELIHSQLSIASYRSLGLYQVPTAGVAGAPGTYTDRVLLGAVNLPPVTVNPAVTENLRFIL